MVVGGEVTVVVIEGEFVVIGYEDDEAILWREGGDDLRGGAPVFLGVFEVVAEEREGGQGD